MSKKDEAIRKLIRYFKKKYPEGPTIYSENDLARLQVIKTMANSMWKNYEKSRKIIRMADYDGGQIDNA